MLRFFSLLVFASILLPRGLLRTLTGRSPFSAKAYRRPTSWDGPPHD